MPDLLTLTPGGPHISYMTHHDYMLGGDKPANAEQRRFVQEAMFTKAEDFFEIRKFYEAVTTKLIREHSKTLGGYWQLDAVKQYDILLAQLLLEDI